MTYLNNSVLRDLGPNDIGRLVEIDASHTGAGRRAFFTKLIEQHQRRPDDSIALGLMRGGALRGFAFARLIRGEFGAAETGATLDAIGVEPESQERGVGHALVHGLTEELERRGARAVRTQADWSEDQLMRFFASCGFRIAPRVVLERATREPVAEASADDAAPAQEPAREINYAESTAPDFGLLARDRIPVRSMAEEDLAAIAAIDRKIVGRDRTAYLARKLDEALRGSGVRVSLIAEIDGRPAGFIMAQVGLGEFGRIEPSAMIDTIGVDPDDAGRGVGRALVSQLSMNLATLRVEAMRTEVDWRDRALLGFLDHCGFRPAQHVCLELPLAAASEQSAAA